MKINESREGIWKSIPRHEDYKVSSLGYIWSSKTDKILKLILQEGYGHVFLYDGEGNSVKMRVHHAVLLAFIGEPLSDQECRHLNGDRSDNRLENLAWGTRLENVQDRRRHGRMPIPHESKFTRLIPQDIPVIRRLQGAYSSRTVASMFKTSHTTIQKIWRRERWKGY